MVAASGSSPSFAIGSAGATKDGEWRWGWALSSFDPGSMAQFGLAAVVLGWRVPFGQWRLEELLRMHTAEIQRLAKAVLLLVVASPAAPAAARDEARRMMGEGGMRGG